MRVGDAIILGVFSLAGLVACEAATAQDLVRRCDGLSADFSNSTVTLGSQQYKATVENYEAKLGSFDLRISPADGLLAERARMVAALQSDLVCMQLDQLPVEMGVGRLDEGTWLFPSGCTGHKARMEDKC
jgi:hypothetical protein